MKSLQLSASSNSTDSQSLRQGHNNQNHQIELTDCHHCVSLFRHPNQDAYQIGEWSDIVCNYHWADYCSRSVYFFRNCSLFTAWIHNTFLIDVVIGFLCIRHWLSQVNDYSFHISFRRWHFSLDNMFICMAGIKSINHISIQLD